MPKRPSLREPWGASLGRISQPIRELLVIHPSSALGSRVKIANGAVVGPNCYLEGDTLIGARTRLVGGITLVGDATIGDDCVIEPGVSMTSLLTPDMAGPLTIGAGVRIGAGSVLTKGVTIGAHARIDAGTIVSRNVPPYAIVKGNPAAIVGYATSGAPDSARRANMPAADPKQSVVTTCSVSGVTIHRFPRVRDLRGDLSVGEFGRNVPFHAKRFFLVFDVPSAETRGEHAHRTCKQFLLCSSGSVAVVVDDGVSREEIVLDAPNLGLYIPPRVWGIQYKYAPGSVLVVFASEYYDPADYIRSYDLFLRECGTTQA